MPGAVYPSEKIAQLCVENAALRSEIATLRAATAVADTRALDAPEDAALSPNPLSTVVIPSLSSPLVAVVHVPPEWPAVFFVAEDEDPDGAGRAALRAQFPDLVFPDLVFPQTEDGVPVPQADAVQRWAHAQDPLLGAHAMTVCFVPGDRDPTVRSLHFAEAVDRETFLMAYGRGAFAR